MSNKMTKMKPSESVELERLQNTGRMHCRDFFGGFIKRNAFIRMMKEYPFITEDDLDKEYVPNNLYPKLPGTFESVMDWAIGCGYISQEEYDEIGAHYGR